MIVQKQSDCIQIFTYGHFQPIWGALNICSNVLFCCVHGQNESNPGF